MARWIVVDAVQCVIQQNMHTIEQQQTEGMVLIIRIFCVLRCGCVCLRACGVVLMRVQYRVQAQAGGFHATYAAHGRMAVCVCVLRSVEVRRFFRVHIAVSDYIFCLNFAYVTI